MAFNKSKALESALKYLNQGKVAQAIGEYRQILRHDPKDQATLMTVGDLYARQNDMPNAIEYFERLAQVYLTDGFNSKAIAIYKKIAKLAPNELAPLERLADLYVQQGVLSEARPLYLQIAEAHLKANRAPKAVEVLHRLLEVEPESPRVQMRLAELYNVLGQKKEAAQTYLSYAQRLLDRGETAEAEKLAERASAVEPGNGDAILLKGRCLAALDKTAEAIAAFEGHPEADAGGEVTHLLIDLELKAGDLEGAADRARNQLVRGSSHCGLLHRVTETLIESGQAEAALPLLSELRDPMIENGEQDKYAASLTKVAEQLPENAAVLEALADFCRTTSDPFRLNSTLNQLADAHAAGGDYSRAEAVLQELTERNKDDERLLAKLAEVRGWANGQTPRAPKASAPVARPVAKPEPPELRVEFATPEPETPVANVDEEFDEETQKFIAQALTDVDLFSSYGLTQKATHLLEAVLERAPRHTPTLERLLDFYLGAGNERRTAELASQLEQIYSQRGDTHNAERFSELRMRFQAAAGMTAEELPSVPPPSQAAPESAAAAPQASAPVAHEPEPPRLAPQAAPAEFDIAVAPMEEEKAAPEQQPVTSASPDEEVDLSDEWEAMLHEPGASADAAPSTEHAEIKLKPEAVPESPLPAEEEAEELDPVLPAAAATPQDFDFELVEETPGKPSAQSTDELISELIAELDGLDAPEMPKRQPAVPVATVQSQATSKPAPQSPTKPKAPAAAPPAPVLSEPVPALTADALNQLSEVFQDFRNDLGESAEDEDEDLETHYNLGIAYREMGLLDEAIGEFQKVAKAIQKGKPFAYAMNCCTLLALSFSDKGEPKIASLWYKRALETPDLDQEAVLALRYDLALSLEQAGEASAALDSFRQVYAMNIDYRDVADHIATLQKR